MREEYILLEAESFGDIGGWTIDWQFIAQMGSSYLLAHGLGEIVRDATTKFSAPGGFYRIWVRTKNWANGAGLFEIHINNNKVGHAFGNGACAWAWEDGGIVSLRDGENIVCLHDLTGFDARCDAILLVPRTDNFVPDDAAPWGWRKQLLGLPDMPPVAGEFDFVVIGGGYAGMCAAVSASRCGLKTALVNNSFMWGGNASNEVRVGPIGRLGLPPFPRNSDLAYELAEITKGHGQTSGGLRPFFDNQKLNAWLSTEDMLSLYPGHCCTGIKMCEDGHRIESVILRNVQTNKECKLRAKLFADCSGDSVVAEMSGAMLLTEQEEGESLKGGYGSTNFWSTCWTDCESAFPACPWALKIEDASYGVSEPKSDVVGDYPYVAGWNWESGIGLDPVICGEEIRDLNFRAAYGMWDYLKNRSQGRDRYRKAKLDWLGFVLGKRFARRVVGDYILSESDLLNNKRFPDGVVTTTWYLDLHMPHPMNFRFFGKDSFRSIAYDDPNYSQVGDLAQGQLRTIKPTAIPYRCFYSKDISNLFIAGKNISTTHVAMASVRVENTVAQMGTMVGRAAYLCVKKVCDPRKLGQVYLSDLRELLGRPGKLSRLAKAGQGRDDVFRELLYVARKLYHKIKKTMGLEYMAEFAG